jgi:hypothetical protein
MKNLVLVAIIGLVSVSAFAQNKLIEAAAQKLKANDTRTVITAVKNTDGSPCLPAGTSYNVELQVKQASFDPQAQKIVYSWETVKTINVDNLGVVMEVCAE